VAQCLACNDFQKEKLFLKIPPRTQIKNKKRSSVTDNHLEDILKNPVHM
jgi:hypothetical protein